MSSSDLAQFAGRNYLSLESFRKNGQGVKTPVWFAEENGVFYFYTEADSFQGEANSQQPCRRIAPCDVRGNLQGTWVDATAELLEATPRATRTTLFVENTASRNGSRTCFRNFGTTSAPRSPFVLAPEPEPIKAPAR